MPNSRLPKSFTNLQKMATYEWRHDKLFCQYLDMGYDPAEAAVMARREASKPLDADMGPEGFVSFDEEEDE